MVHDQPLGLQEFSDGTQTQSLATPSDNVLVEGFNGFLLFRHTQPRNLT